MYRLLMVLALCLVGCSDELIMKADPTYKSIQINLISPFCVRCHSGFESYHGLLRVISMGKPLESKFYTMMAKGAMPPYDGAKFNEKQLKPVFDWIAAGALHD